MVQRSSDGNAVLNLVFDTELGWGSIENGLYKHREGNQIYEDTRLAVSTILEELDSIGCPATWAIVGALLEKPGDYCLDHLPVSFRDRAHRAITHSKESTFFGGDIIDRIHHSRINHKFISHTYSHVRFQHPDVTKSIIRKDLSHYWRVVPEGLNHSPTLVFPCNEEGYYEDVAEKGFRSVRGPARVNQFGNRVINRVVKAIAPPPLSVKSEVKPNLIRFTGSMFFNTGAGRLHRLPWVYLNAMRGLNSAVREQGTLHVWCHPFNFAETPWLLTAFKSFLHKAASLYEDGLIRIESL